MRRALVLLAFLCGCADLAKDTTVCPEYRNLRCPAGSTCSFDSSRGCRVCECNAVNGFAPVTGPDQGNVPPPVVTPQN